MVVNDEILLFESYNECLGINYTLDKYLLSYKKGIITNIKLVDNTNYDVPWNVFIDKYNEYEVIDNNGTKYICSHYNNAKYKNWICTKKEYIQMLNKIIKSNNDSVKDYINKINSENLKIDKVLKKI